MYIFETSQNAIQLQKEIQGGGKSMRGKQNGIWSKKEDESRKERGVAEVHRKGKEL
jgi:hypothetical protein